MFFNILSKALSRGHVVPFILDPRPAGTNPIVQNQPSNPTPEATILPAALEQGKHRVILVDAA